MSNKPQGVRDTFASVLEFVKSYPKKKVAVACAADEAVFKSAEIASNEGILDFTFFDNILKIKKAAETYNADISSFELIEAKSEREAAQMATASVRSGGSQILMKGHLPTGMFLKAVLDKQNGLRKSKILSHIQVFECPLSGKLKMLSDGGMNLYPGYEELYNITKNAIEAFIAICGRAPVVALISAYNHPVEKLRTSIDMAAIAGELSMRHEGKRIEIFGPVTLDVALSGRAAEKKMLKIKGAGEADIFIVPNIETGNLMGKSLMYFSKSPSAGLLFGTSSPVIMLSRADDHRTKLNSMALGSLLAM